MARIPEHRPNRARPNPQTSQTMARTKTTILPKTNQPNNKKTREELTRPLQLNRIHQLHRRSNPRNRPSHMETRHLTPPQQHHTRRSHETNRHKLHQSRRIRRKTHLPKTQITPTQRARFKRKHAEVFAVRNRAPQRPRMHIASRLRLQYTS